MKYRATSSEMKVANRTRWTGCPGLTPGTAHGGRGGQTAEPWLLTGLQPQLPEAAIGIRQLAIQPFNDFLLFRSWGEKHIREASASKWLRSRSFIHTVLANLALTHVKKETQTIARPTDTMCIGFRIRESQRRKDLDLPTERWFSGNAGSFLGTEWGWGSWRRWGEP